MVTLNPFKTLDTLRSDGLDLGKFSKLFAVMVKFITPLLIIFVEIMGVLGKLEAYGKNYWSIIITSILLILLSIILFFTFFYKQDCGSNEDEKI